MEQFEGKRKKGSVVSLDLLARKGNFKDGDLPGTDTYDDGMNEKGEIIMPGSTSVEAGGTYMEDAGPNDLIRRGGGEDTERAESDGLNVTEQPHFDVEMETSDDDAARWLRENDPQHKHRAA